MTYFYAKVGRGNSLATESLAGQNSIGMPAIPIFFNGKPSNRAEFEESGGAKDQGSNFFWCADNPSEARIVVIHEGHIYVVRPSGSVVFHQNQEDSINSSAGDYIKYLPIKIDLAKRLAGVPAILSSMTANAHYYTGTFRRISDEGNIRALQAILNREILPIDPTEPHQLLQCLSSIELETLVAKIFEESGCFVPAYRGGAIKGIDIFAENRTENDIQVGDVRVRAGTELSIQVKRFTRLTQPPRGCDLLISLTQDSDWLLKEIKSRNRTNHWLRQSLDWLPAGTFTEIGLV